jgi:hypothetical protein
MPSLDINTCVITIFINTAYLCDTVFVKGIGNKFGTYIGVNARNDETGDCGHFNLLFG